VAVATVVAAKKVEAGEAAAEVAAAKKAAEVDAVDEQTVD
jgi:hypothetical protein